MKVIVLPDESEYVNVYSISDITNENKAFILKNDIVISEAYNQDYIINEFNGALLNPDGYLITIEQSTGLRALCKYNYGLFQGVKLNAFISNDYDMSVCGLTEFNLGFMKDCELDSEIETIRGRVELNNIYDSALRCTYTLLPNPNGSSYITVIPMNLFDSDIQFIFRGVTTSMEEQNRILPVNTVYKQIIEQGDFED
ncbi:hypothetical protein EOM82_05575 [bacterium]|nr:hypothetical protein [bacterium]